jgi:hypothetical protein
MEPLVSSIRNVVHGDLSTKAVCYVDVQHQREPFGEFTSHVLYVAFSSDNYICTPSASGI